MNTRSEGRRRKTKRKTFPERRWSGRSVDSSNTRSPGVVKAWVGRMGRGRPQTPLQRDARELPTWENKCWLRISGLCVV